jgi:DNA-binding transcriptional MerR regulator
MDKVTPAGSVEAPMSYRIKRVAHITGINPATLRAWERRYGLVAPDRTGSGYRLYSDEDVAMLSRIKTLVDEGLTIGEAISRVRRGTEPLPLDAGGPSMRDLRLRLLEALMTFDRRGAVEAYEEVLSLPPERRVEELLLPVLRHVGELWASNECGVGQEHFATAFVRGKLAGIIEDLDTGAARGPEAVCGGVPGELHECGLLAAAIHLATRGWRVVYLGTNMPIDDLRRILHQRRALLHLAGERDVDRRLPRADARAARSRAAGDRGGGRRPRRPRTVRGRGGGAGGGGAG